MLRNNSYAVRAGNNPWPIGVTSVGIHERSAREKISHVMNGGAHIMNDEATRKYLQASRKRHASMDFTPIRDFPCLTCSLYYMDAVHSICIAKGMVLGPIL